MKPPSQSDILTGLTGTLPGMQVAPVELEALLLTHPKIADAAVVPKADDEAEEIPKASGVLRDDLSEEAILEFVAERLAPHEKIRAVEFVDRIPKSPSGQDPAPRPCRVRARGRPVGVAGDALRLDGVQTESS
jgi:acyl-CoA synthetase (AMP-forming)/AMP-acid ligase II